MDLKRLEVFCEFLIFGIIIGMIEDLLVVKLATGAPITLRIVGIIIAIAIPFAILGELVVDKVDFVEIFRKLFKRNFRAPSN